MQKEGTRQVSHVSNLPVELLAEIFSFLRAQELGLIAALVCKTWWKVICTSSDDGSYGVSPWRSLLIRDYGVPASYEKSEDSWLECYQIFARYFSLLLWHHVSILPVGGLGILQLAQRVSC